MWRSWSLAPISGTGPKGRGFESHCRHVTWVSVAHVITVGCDCL
uniref:Uncharacterized protein n=1 Tax=Physcomitrium patens TaxID=3218 RepID=A0A2K1K757_PHYPA|nr:hypothetical protein PHYPA_011507 [Physcomitrium patens]